MSMSTNGDVMSSDAQCKNSFKNKNNSNEAIYLVLSANFDILLSVIERAAGNCHIADLLTLHQALSLGP